MALDNPTTWNWYRPLTFADKSGCSENYQVKIRLYSGAKTIKDRPGSGLISQIDLNETCVNFPRDIRFGTTSDPATATQLDQWYETSGGGARKLSWVDVWLELPSDGSDLFYLFTNNSSADTYSSGQKTFIFFDDFCTTGNWNDTTNAGGHFTISSNRQVTAKPALCFSGAVSDATYHRIFKDLGQTYNSIKLMGRCKTSKYGKNKEQHIRTRVGLQKTTYAGYLSGTISLDMYDFNNTYGHMAICNDACTAYGGSNYNTQLIQAGTAASPWIRFLMRYPYSSAIYKDESIGIYNIGGVATTRARNTFSNPRYLEICRAPSLGDVTNSTLWDWVAVGKYVNKIEPTGAIWGSWTAITAPVVSAGGGMIYISCQNTSSGMYMSEDYSLDNMSYLKPAYIG